MSQDKSPYADGVESLIRIGGRRVDPPTSAQGRVWTATLDTWHRQQARRRTRATLGWLAAAAALVAAVGAVISLSPASAPPATVARLDRAVGSAEVRQQDEDAWRPIAPSSEVSLVSGTSLRTSPDGRLGIEVAGGVSVRLAEASEIRLSADRRIRLIRGTIYVDTGPYGHAGPIQVVTAAATFEDFGTQFEVKYVDEGVRLRVREGQVVFDHQGDRVAASAEQQVDIGPDGEVTRRTIARSDASWNWVESVSPAAPTDGHTMATLLEWVSRETGRGIRYADADIRREAMTTTLHGQLSGVSPLETLDVMLATTHLTYEISDDQAIEVSRRMD